MSRRVLGCVLVFFGLSAASPALASGLYKFTDLGSSEASDINNHGDVALREGVYRSYGPNAGTVATLSDYGLPSGSRITGINDHGQVAGVVDRGDGGGTVAFVTQGGTPVYVPRLPNQVSADVAKVNNAGVVAGNVTANIGYYPPAGSDYHSSRGFLFQNGNVVDVDPAVAFPSVDVNGLNNSGQLVVSTIAPPLGPFHAFVYQNGGLTELGTLGDSLSHQPMAINDQGQIVGSAVAAAGADFIGHGFLYQNGVMTDLGTLSGPGGISLALDINNLGDVVGDSDGSAVLWKDGAILDLNNALASPLPYHLTTAIGINDLGQILGVGHDSNGVSKSFLLTPIDQPDMCTPEPGTWALFGVLGLGCLWRRRGSR